MRGVQVPEENVACDLPNKLGHKGEVDEFATLLLVSSSTFSA